MAMVVTAADMASDTHRIAQCIGDPFGTTQHTLTIIQVELFDTETITTGFLATTTSIAPVIGIDKMKMSNKRRFQVGQNR
jgi:protein-disulfide isomerase-like protein with CxxC motif